MRDTKEVEPLLREYADVQQRLCAALFEKYPIDDVNYLTEIPPNGTVLMGNAFWEFRRHGRGICFTNTPKSEVVDVHVEPFAHPCGLDAWRLTQNLKSRGIAAVNDGASVYNTSDYAALELMLRRLCESGRLTLVNHDRHIYALRDTTSVHH